MRSRAAATPPSVSVALCTHNGARFVERQLASIASQTHLPDQVVVSDDASTDTTKALVEATFAEWAAAGLKTKTVLMENGTALGVTQNFEQALRACSGDLIMLSDQDDEWEPHRVATALAAWERFPHVALVASDAWLIDDSGASLGQTLWSRLRVTAKERAGLAGPEPWRVLMRRNVVTGATVALRRSSLETALPFPDNWVHDEWLAMMAALTTGLHLDATPSVRYRQHASNVIGVRRLTPRYLWTRIAQDGSTRNANLLLRAQRLVERCEQLGDKVPEQALALAQRKLRHETFRAQLPASRWRRVNGICVRWAWRDYSVVGRGFADVVRDLVQPLASTENTH